MPRNLGLHTYGCRTVPFEQLTASKKKQIVSDYFALLRRSYPANPTRENLVRFLKKRTVLRKKSNIIMPTLGMVLVEHGAAKGLSRPEMSRQLRLKPQSIRRYEEQLVKAGVLAVTAGEARQARFKKARKKLKRIQRIALANPELGARRLLPVLRKAGIDAKLSEVSRAKNLLLSVGRVPRLKTETTTKQAAKIRQLMEQGLQPRELRAIGFTPYQIRCVWDSAGNKFKQTVLAERAARGHAIRHGQTIPTRAYHYWRNGRKKKRPARKRRK